MRAEGIWRGYPSGGPLLKIAAEIDNHEGREGKHGGNAGGANYVHDDKPVLAVRRIVVEAVEQHLIDRRSDGAARGFVEAQTNVASLVLDAVEIARYAPGGRQEHDGAGMDVLIRVGVVGVVEADGVRESAAGSFVASQKVPAGFGTGTSVRFHIGRFFRGGDFGRF